MGPGAGSHRDRVLTRTGRARGSGAAVQAPSAAQISSSVSSGCAAPSARIPGPYASVALVRAWLVPAGITGGRLLRSANKGGNIGERLDPSLVPRIFKHMARRAGLPAELVDGLSGHSTRVGAPLDMIARRPRAFDDPPSRALEVRRDGQPLRRAAARAEERRGAARAAAAAGHVTVSQRRAAD